MNKRKSLCIILIFLTLSCSFLSLFPISENNETNYLASSNEKSEYLYREDKLKSSNAINTLNYSSIYQNTSIIRRGFESVYFKVNVSGLEHANITHIEISFTNNPVLLFKMNYTLSTNKNFTYEYKPKGDAPLGFHRVRFLVYNESENLLNTGTTYTNFTVRSTSMVGFNSSEYYRGEDILADISIDDSDKYDWKITVVNSTDEFQQNIIEKFNNNPFQINFTIDESFDQVDHYYFVGVNMTEDSWNTWNVDYFGFLIKNFDPLISNIELSPSSVFRAQFCAVTLNVSDIESVANDITVEMKITDTLGQPVSITNPDLYNTQGNIFEGNFTISAGRPKGNYDIEFTATDGNEGVTIQNTGVLIKNNPPEIDGYEINDIDTDERISVPYGDDLEFNFDVSDLEGISYITVKLIMEDAVSDDEDEDEYEVSIAYEEDPELTIRTEDLTPGTWTVYVSVTDTDGATTDLDDDYGTGPQQITIIPDLISDVLPWVMLVVGSIIGVIVGIGFGYHVGKSKYAKFKPVEEKVPPKKKPKTTKKPVKEKVTPTKPKRVEKEVKTEPEKEEPKKPAPKRKIKRKL